MNLPDGYRIVTQKATYESDPKKLRLFYGEIELASKWPDIYGWSTSIRYLKRIARKHRRNRIDR